MTTTWERLRLSNDEKTPPLLYKFISTAYTYEIYMTDLTNVWAEQLSRQAILRRANDENTTIDPSEDVEQFGVLLQKIRDALHGEAGSSAALNHQSSGDSLELITYTELPAPLEPLKWTLRLSKESPSASTSQLLLPLVMAEADWEARQQALIEQLHKKDWVLGKLFDKIETMGIDLGTIFPGTSGLRTGRKGTTLSQAARYIKGVAPFDEQAWREEISKSSPDLGFAANIVKAFTGASSTGSFEGLDPPPDAWWEQVGTHDSPLAVPTHNTRDKDVETKDVKEDDATETDAGTETEDEFERQETPPRLKQSREAGRKPSDSTDEEETDENIKEPAKKPPPQPTHPTKATRSLGVIGGRRHRKPASPEPSTQPSATTKSNKPSHPSSNATHSDDETDSASDLDAPSSRRQPPKPKSPETKTHPKSGLGVIGGRKKEQQKPSSPPAPNSPSKKTTQHSKLGVIGGRASRSAEPRSSPTHHHHHTASSSPASPPKPTSKTKTESPSTSSKKHQPQTPPKAEPEPETEQEKADRKREELKRQLEMKSKAPAKKKRRF
ncbi:XLF-domain-containing protein [Aspergillus campestris IBT 28561]|uniref:Non-homologous end-joining factor 1 n=1 Tax=Aspergillus campestris (strain IBT 28561) TaxID=1392248 RepID=A0A2I1D9G2_ASPC2|nr:XLF-domain-containing protein [Aspergillus campestris IBT 28561]PKY06510.1 XLF-domain-containing protein [Aspergillus campestris IBT 28561]